MTNSVRFLLALVTGLAVGWFVGHSRAPQRDAQIRFDLPVGDHTVLVGPEAYQLSDDPIEISQAAGHKVRWVAQVSTHAMDIVFQAADFPRLAKGEPPFQGGETNKNQIIHCNPNNICNAPPLNPKLPKLKLGQKLYYKYGQILTDGSSTDEADGMIIIDK